MQVTVHTVLRTGDESKESNLKKEHILYLLNMLMVLSKKDDIRPSNQNFQTRRNERVEVLTTIWFFLLQGGDFTLSNWDGIEAGLRLRQC